MKNYQPIGHVGETGDIAKMVEFVISDDKASFITGSNFVVDGGLQLRNQDG